MCGIFTVNTHGYFSVFFHSTERHGLPPVPTYFAGGYGVGFEPKTVLAWLRQI